MIKQKSWKAEEVISLVPDELLDNLADETGVDYSVQKLHGKTVFKLFLFAFLNGGSISLRILEAIFKSERFRSLFNVPAKILKHSAIGMRLHKINYRYFEGIFTHLVSSPELDSVLFDRKKINARKIDTTIVTLSSKLLKFGLDDNPGVKTLKFGVELRASLPVNVVCYKGQEYLSEDNALPKLVFGQQQKKALNIAIFDRGIQRKQNFVNFQKAGIYFISRLSTQKVKIIKYLTVKETETKALTVLSDQIIRFASNENLKPEDAHTEFRLITGKNKDTNQQIAFLTNVYFLSAVEIADLYKSRWEIETFFKFIKQQLNFSHLLSRSENGIKAVMYLTMIAAVLLTLYKKFNKIMGWAVAKIKFLDELGGGVIKDWHTEMTPAFAYLKVVPSFNSS